MTISVAVIILSGGDYLIRRLFPYKPYPYYE
jgi:hypothetical protein